MRKKIIGILGVIIALSLIRIIQYHFLYTEDRDIVLKEIKLENYVSASSRGRVKKDNDTEIISVRLIEETLSYATFELTYNYYGSRENERIWFAAYRINKEVGDIKTGFRPGRILAGGNNKTRVQLTLIKSSNNKSDSDAVLFEAYPSSGASFHTQTYKFEKHWCKERAEIWQLFSSCN